MFGKPFADHFDSGRDSFGKPAGFEVWSNDFHDVVPKVFAAFGVNTFIADDREILGGRGYKNEDAVAESGFLHAHFEEHGFAVQEGIFHWFFADIDADLGGGAALGFLDGFEEPVFVEVIEKIFCVHITRSLKRHRRRNFRHRH